MNKLRLPLLLILSAFTTIVIQSCNKDAVTAVVYTSAAFQANINGSTWAPDTVSASVYFNPDTKLKTFSCIGTKTQKQVIFSVDFPNSTNSAGIALGTYTIDGANIKAQYKTQQLSGGNYIFLPHGTVEPGSGSIVVTAIDSVKKQITGTFNFYSRTTVYDNDGNVLSIDVDNIAAGVFNNLPYTFSSQGN